jgi:hypothetical protein
MLDRHIELLRNFNRHLNEMTLDVSEQHYVAILRVIPVLASVMSLSEREKLFSFMTLRLKQMLIKSLKARLDPGLIYSQTLY